MEPRHDPHAGPPDRQGLRAHPHDGRAEGGIEGQGRLGHAAPISAVIPPDWGQS